VSLIASLVQTKAYLRHIRYVASLILHLAYGHRVNSTDDIYVRISETGVTEFIEAGSPGNQVVDFIPACESSTLFFRVLIVFLELKASSSEIYTGVDAWDGVQTKRFQGSQKCG